MTSLHSTKNGPHAGQSVEVIGNLVTFKAVSRDTSGAYSLVEVESQPGAGTPPHIQHDDDEAFFVLDGVFRLQIGEQQLEARQGDYYFIPRGTVHAFRNGTDAPARMLILNSPGGLHENFFAETGTPVGAPAAPPDFALFMESAARYGIEILPPQE